MIGRELLTNSNEVSMATVLKRELYNSDECIIISAFISKGLHNMLIGQLETAIDSGKRIKILTSTMNHFNSPEVLKSFQTIVGELKIYGTPGQHSALHIKSYLFSNENSEEANVIIIGSSNFTYQGLNNNKEWNILLRGDKDVFHKAYTEFMSYWENESFSPDEHFYSNYQQAEFPETVRDTSEMYIAPIPNSFQTEAIDKLQSFRSKKISRAIVIAATGVGKTFLAAFDFKKSKYKRILFIAHRTNILEKSKYTFTKVMGSHFNSIIISGTSSRNDRFPDKKISGVFAMVQTFSNPDILYNWPSDYFDYIVIDEFHHAGADSYKLIIEYFKPKFLLGLTATPERMDGRNVIKLCDNNIAFEMRLFDAIEEKLLVPFYYYAIYDEGDYSAIRWDGNKYNQKDLDILLSNDTRSKLILKNLNKYLSSGSHKIKALGFCSSKNHALFMKDSFNKLGKTSEVVLGETSESERNDIINRLSNDNDSLEVVFSVDVFTEGVDIPDLTHILLLRPTQSFTVFQQQIGRGLRLHKSKEFVNILDFIGNYKTNYIPYLTLRGMSSVNIIDKDKLTDNTNLPSNCFVDENIEVVRIQKERLLQLFKPKKIELLKSVYKEVKEDYETIDDSTLIKHNLSLMDFFDHPSVDDVKIYISNFGGNWLRVKEEMDDLSDFEKSILNTKGELLLQHIEKELRPTRSYKMVVLFSIINKQADKTGWDIENIAIDFKNFYLQNKKYLNDYSAMAKTQDPEKYPINKVINHLIKMPLKYLSNNDNDFFNLDIVNRKFYLRDNDGDLLSWWNNIQFKELVKDRINYALKNYFFRRKML